MRKFFIIIMMFHAVAASANVIQFLGGLSFNNPALLAQIKNNEFILGATVVYNNLVFNGTQLDLRTFEYPYGQSRVSTTSFVPFGRAAQRINDKWVFSLDVTQPFHSNLDWGRYSVGRYAAVDNFLRDYDFSPKLAFQFSKKLQIGAGINFNVLRNNEVSWVLPTGPVDSLLVNKTSSVGYGFNAGFNYAITPMDQIGYTYYSRIKQRSEGYSRLGSQYRNNTQFFFNMPETMVLSYLHIFNQKWLANIQILRTSWNISQSVTFRNTVVGDFTFNMSYKAAMGVLAVIRHQYNDKWAFSLFGMIDDGPENSNLRPLVFPSDVQYIGAVTTEYFFTPTTMVQVLAGALYSKTILNNTIPVNGQRVSFTHGNVKIAAPFIEARIKISR